MEYMKTVPDKYLRALAFVDPPYGIIKIQKENDGGIVRKSDFVR